MVCLMKLNEVINKYYDEWLRFVKTKNVSTVVDEACRTSDDILQDVMVTAIRKYGDTDVDEQEALEYVKLTLCTELAVQYKRKPKMIFRIGDMQTFKYNEADD